MYSPGCPSKLTVMWIAIASWIAIPRTHAFGPSIGHVRVTATATSTSTSQLGVNLFSSVGNLVLSGSDSDLGSGLVTEPATTAAAVATNAAFSDQIDYFGDPLVRTIVLVFGGVFLLLAGLAVLSKKMDAAIENVIVDFEEVMTSSPEFRDQWEEIELQLKIYDNEIEKAQLRKQKLFEIMEELEEKEPKLMKRVSAKMAILNSRSNR